MDESVNKHKIVTQDWPHAAVSVKKCTAAFLAFAQAVTAGKGRDEVDRAYDRLSVELGAYEFTVSRLRHVRRRCDAEAHEARALNEDIDRSIEGAASSIEALKRELEAAKLDRKRRLEYEAIARTVNKLPTREALLG